jgi:hypothetical protein
LSAEKLEPCVRALDGIWNGVLVAQSPTYGEWEYPGQVQNHVLQVVGELRAENARLRALVAAVGKWDDTEPSEKADDELSYAYVIYRDAPLRIDTSSDPDDDGASSQ